MRLQRLFLFALPLLALALPPIKDASASGGCFLDSAQQEQTQVTGHRMILSISKTKTTLWDQITFAGDPQSFAWVLPIKGKAEVGVSSGALFDQIEGTLRRSILSPEFVCGKTPECAGSYNVTVSDKAEQEELQVIARDVVGPYEMVQLSSQDPTALKTWLSDRDYIIPDDISPVISTYVAEGFNLLAIKLVPGQGIKAMKPIRVTTSGANPVLPLRMVAAGAGPIVPISLWVLGADKYVPLNFPSFFIPESDLVWDWDKKESNYKSLRQDGFTETSGKGWLIARSGRISPSFLSSALLDLALNSPEESGYGDGMTVSPLEACGADIDALVSDINFNAFTVTALQAELPREALVTDPILGVASYQDDVVPHLKATRAVGTAPACPVDPPCLDVQKPGNDPPITDNMMGADGCACSTSGEADSSTVPFGAVISLGWVLARRRKKAGPTISP
jgi:MYXO-CTERM domain-containing protein